MRGRFVASLVALAACGAQPGAPDRPDASDASDAPFVPAAHAAPPPLPFQGGAVLGAASLVVVTFAGYPLADGVEAMADWLPQSQWLAATGAQYGVAAPAVLAKVRLGASAPPFASTAAFSAFVASEVGTDLPSPPTASTLYAFVLPAGEPFSDPSIGTLCGSFTGYHDAGAGRAYAFAAIGTCPNHVAGLTDLEQVERVLSHEVIEALTDPFGDGWAARDPEDPWSWIGGGEVADVCDGFVREQGFLAVRSWSNDAAAAGLDPCEPTDPPSPYFGLTGAQPTALHLAAGQTATVTLDGFSTAPTADWVVDLVTTPRGFAPTVTFAPGPMNNGRPAVLAIDVPASAASGAAALLQLRSHHAGEATYTLEPLVVRVP